MGLGLLVFGGLVLGSDLSVCSGRFWCLVVAVGVLTLHVASLYSLCLLHLNAILIGVRNNKNKRIVCEI